MPWYDSRGEHPQNPMDIRISSHDAPVPPDFSDLVTDKASGLTAVFPDIVSFEIDCRMDRHHRNGDVMTVIGMIHVPGSVIRAEEHAPDAMSAVDLLLPKLRRQLERYRSEAYDSARRRKSRWSWRTLMPFMKSDDTELAGDESTEMADSTAASMDPHAPHRHLQIVRVLTETEALHAVEESPLDIIVYKDAMSKKVCVMVKHSADDHHIIETNLA